MKADGTPASWWIFPPSGMPLLDDLQLTCLGIARKEPFPPLPIFCAISR